MGNRIQSERLCLRQLEADEARALLQGKADPARPWMAGYPMQGTLIAVEAFVRAVDNGADPGAYSAEGYDAANAIIAGIQKLNGNDVNREKVADSVLHGSYTGLTKEVKFDDKGEVATRTIFVYQVKAGKRVVIGTTVELAK